MEEDVISFRPFFVQSKRTLLRSVDLEVCNNRTNVVKYFQTVTLWKRKRLCHILRVKGMNERKRPTIIYGPVDSEEMRPVFIASR